MSNSGNGSNIRCPNCNKVLRKDSKYCITCGDKIKSLITTEKNGFFKGSSVFDASKSTEVIKKGSSFISSKFFSTGFIGIFGLILLGFAIFRISETIDIELPPYFIIIIGYGVTFVLTTLSILLVSKSDDKKNLSFSIFLILLPGEFILIATMYYLNITEPNLLHRYLFLSVVAVFGIQILLSPKLIEKIKYEQYHRVILIYVSWLIINYLAGHSHISRWALTSVIVGLVIIIHFSSLYHGVFSIVATAVILEFFVLIQTQVINSSQYLLVSIVTITSVPIILFFLDREMLKTSNENKNKSNLSVNGNIREIMSILFQIPTIAIFIGISSGGLLSPFAELVIGLYILTWVGYLRYSGSKGLINERFLKRQSYLVAIVIIITLTLYSRNYNSPFYFLLFLISLLIINILMSYFDEIRKKQIQSITVLVSGYIAVQLYLANLFIDPIGLLFSVVAFFVINFNDFSRGILRDDQIYSLIGGWSLYLIILFSEASDQLSNQTIILYSIFCLISLYSYTIAERFSNKFEIIKITITIKNTFRRWSPAFLTSVMVTFTFIMIFQDLPDQIEKFWYFLSLTLFIGVNPLVVELIDKTSNPKISMDIHSKQSTNVLSLLSLTSGLMYASSVYTTTLYLLMTALIIFSFACIQAISNLIFLNEIISTFTIQQSPNLFFIFASLMISLAIKDADGSLLLFSFAFFSLIIISWYIYQLVIWVSNRVQKIIDHHILNYISIGGFITTIIATLSILAILNNQVSLFEISLYFIYVEFYFVSWLILIMRNKHILQNFPNLRSMMITLIMVIQIFLLNFVDIIGKNIFILIFVLIFSYEHMNHEVSIDGKINWLWLSSYLGFMFLISYQSVVWYIILTSITYYLLMFSPNIQKMIVSIITDNPIKITAYRSIVNLSFTINIIFASTMGLHPVIGILMTTIFMMFFNFKPLTDVMNGQHMIFSFLYLSYLILWTNIYVLGIAVIYHYLYYSFGLITLGFVLNKEISIYFKTDTVGIILPLTWQKLGVGILTTIEVYFLISIIAVDTRINLIILNQILGISMFLIIVIIAFIESKFNSSLLTQGVLLGSIIMAISSSFFGYFSSPFSNLILNGVVVSLILLALKQKQIIMFDMAKIFYILAVAKSFFDLFLLSPVDYSISILSTGINGILFGIIINQKLFELSEDNE